MTSANKAATNRANAKNSTGPKTPGGKSRARRNSLRHGLASATLRNTSLLVQIELAKMICGEGATPLQYDLALTIAECAVMIQNVRAARVAAIERASAATPRAVLADTKQAHAKKLALGDDQATPVLHLIDATRNEHEGPSAPHIRDEVAALRGALPDLLRLDRYEGRAYSRQRRAIRRFLANSILNEAASAEGGPTTAQPPTPNVLEGPLATTISCWLPVNELIAVVWQNEPNFPRRADSSPADPGRLGTPPAPGRAAGSSLDEFRRKCRKRKRGPRPQIATVERGEASAYRLPETQDAGAPLPLGEMKKEKCAAARRFSGQRTLAV
jgi:hypothetical protein